MRDWGHRLKKSIEQATTYSAAAAKAPFGDNGFIEKTPEALARWVGLDSTALSKIDEGDLVDELEVRLFQYASLPAGALCENIEGVIAKYKGREEF